MEIEWAFASMEIGDRSFWLLPGRPRPDMAAQAVAEQNAVVQAERNYQEAYAQVYATPAKTSAKRKRGEEDNESLLAALARPRAKARIPKRSKSV